MTIMKWPPTFPVPMRSGTVALRPYASADGRELFDALADERVWEHMSRSSPADAAELDELLCSKLQDGSWMTFTVRDHGTAVGVTSLSYDDDDPGGLEVGGTLLDPRVWGTGVNPRTKRLLFDAAFAAGAKWVTLRTDERNLRSAAAIRKVGAVDLGVIDETHRRRDGTVRRSRVFRLEAHGTADRRH